MKVGRDAIRPLCGLGMTGWLRSGLGMTGWLRSGLGMTGWLRSGLGMTGWLRSGLGMTGWLRSGLAVRVRSRVLAQGLSGLLVLPSHAAFAGWLVAPSITSTAFSFEPEATEPTPNYYGYGGGLSAGYSVRQLLDLAVFGRYLPGNRGVAKPNREDAAFFAYGGELAARMGNSLYFGLRGGTSQYRLVSVAREHDVRGHWTGPAFGMSLGAFFPHDKQKAMQATFDLMHAIIERKDASETASSGKRRLSSIGLSLTYVFNGYQSNRIDSSLFQGFLNSKIFNW